jgi:hypothetical protein
VQIEDWAISEGCERAVGSAEGRVGPNLDEMKPGAEMVRAAPED